MTIQLDGVTVTTTMRTPGNDYELAVGFCHTEGLLDGAAVTGVRYCADAPPEDQLVQLWMVRERSARRPL